MIKWRSVEGRLINLDKVQMIQKTDVQRDKTGWFILYHDGAGAYWREEFESETLRDFIFSELEAALTGRNAK